MSDLTLKNITKIFGKGDAEVIALRNVDLEIKKGEMIAIIGPSGSGKTTLMNIIGCISKPTKGQYLVDANSVEGMSEKQLALLRNQRFGFVVQNFALINDYTIFENVSLPLDYSKKKDNKSEKVRAQLKMLKIEDKLKKYPYELSGGQRQRVAIARALINDPDVILADEPTGALDQNTGEIVLDFLKEINTLGKTVIVVTHDMDIAKRCNRVVRIVDGGIAYE